MENIEIRNKTEYQKTLFTNRIKKKSKELKKWARKNKISCYRIYDKDIPEIPISLDIYELLPDYITTQAEAAQYIANINQRISNNDLSVQNEISINSFAVLYLYERPYDKDQSEEDYWLEQMALAASETLNIPLSNIVKKQRKKQRGTNQYEKEDSSVSKAIQIKGITQEFGELFYIDLTSYLDTGLFLDHRPLRAKVREISNKKSVLNLFCYTGSFSVYAAQSGAKKVESVDLSNTYLNLAKENMKLNGFSNPNSYIFTRQDCIEFLKEKAVNAKKSILKPEDYYDLIILDPPTFSNSKNTFNVLDINRDWPQLVKDCLNILAPGGILYFSTNSTKLTFDTKLIPQFTASNKAVMITDITEESIPKDFEGTKCHKAWEFKIAK